MKNHPLLRLLPLLLLLLLVTATLRAEERTKISRQEAANIALEQYPGRVLAVKPVQQRNTPMFRVKTLSEDGNVHIIMIDAVSGRVISRR